MHSFVFAYLHPRQFNVFSLPLVVCASCFSSLWRMRMWVCVVCVTPHMYPVFPYILYGCSFLSLSLLNFQFGLFVENHCRQRFAFESIFGGVHIRPGSNSDYSLLLPLLLYKCLSSRSHILSFNSRSRSLSHSEWLWMLFCPLPHFSIVLLLLLLLLHAAKISSHTRWLLFVPYKVPSVWVRVCIVSRRPGFVVILSSFQCFYRVSPGKLTGIRSMLDVYDRFCDGGSGGGSSSINIDGDNDAAASSYPTRCDTDIYMAHGTTKSQQQKQTESKSTGWVNAFILFTIKWMDDGALDTRGRQQNLVQKKYSCISDALAPAPQWAIKNCIVIAMQWDFLWIYFSWDCALVSIKTKDGGSDSNNDNDSIQLTQHQLEMELQWKAGRRQAKNDCTVK